MLESYIRLTNRLVNRVSDARGTGRRTRESLVSSRQREQFVEALRLAAQQGLSTGLVSEASLRLKIAGHLLLTPPEAWFPALKESALVVANPGQILIGSALPRHVDLHWQLYRQTGAAAALLCQPAAVMVWAQRRGIALPDLVESTDLRLLVGDAPELSADHNAYLIPKIGLLTYGADLHLAIALADLTNRLCEIALYLE